MLTYNHSDCVGDSIQSLLSQTYRNFELRIVDDFSEDETFSILQNFEERDSRVHVARNSSNLGMFENFRINLEKISTVETFDQFAWVGPDDEWSETWLEKLIREDSIESSFGVRQSNVEYKFGNKVEMRQYKSLSNEKLTYQDSKEIRKGYGQLLHGLWNRKTVELVIRDSRILPFKYLLKLENLFIALLIEKGGFFALNEPLHTKQKATGSQFRYTQNVFFQNPSKILLTIIRTLPQVIKLIKENRKNRMFILGGWMIDFRLALPFRVKK